MRGYVCYIYLYYKDILEISKRLDEQMHEGISFLEIVTWTETLWAYLTPVTFIFLPSDAKIIKVPRLSRTDVWTKFEGSRPRHSRVIDQKQKCYRRTDGQTTYQPTCANNTAILDTGKGYACNILQSYTAIRTLDM